QRGGADDAAGDRDVVADDRVLQDVGEEEQHDEVEAVELPQLALARQPQRDDDESVDDNRAQNSLPPRNLQDPDVVPHDALPPSRRDAPDAACAACDSSSVATALPAVCAWYPRREIHPGRREEQAQW